MLYFLDLCGPLLSLCIGKHPPPTPPTPTYPHTQKGNSWLLPQFVDPRLPCRHQHAGMDQKDFFAATGSTEAQRYKLLEVIGKGSYGVVASAQDQFTGRHRHKYRYRHRL